MFATTRPLLDLSGEPALMKYLEKSLDKFRANAVKNPASRLAELKIIHLRGPVKREAPKGYAYDLSYTDCEDRELFSQFPEVQALIGFIRGALNLQQLGNVMMSEMGPGAFIEPHFDPGQYFEHYRRIHVPIVTDPKCICYSMEHPMNGRLESVNMSVGNVWELNNSDLHWFHHLGEKPRFHVVFDAC